MALSRVRLGLATWFAVIFLAGLAILDLSLYWYLRDQSNRRLTRDLIAVASQLVIAARREYAETPGEGLSAAAGNATAEWPAGPEAVAIYDSSGNLLAAGGAAALAHFAPRRMAEPLPRDLPMGDEASARLVSVPVAGRPAFMAVAIGSTERLSEDDEALAWWLAISSPLVGFLSLIAGYLISHRALRPIEELGRAVAAIRPNTLDQRLTVSEPPDEIGRLASQFNQLLERLEQSQARSQLFLKRAAHQIRTPLTLVLGESELALDRSVDRRAERATLDRIHRAAQQMRHRVDELFLFAQAEAGEPIVLTSAVDLDGLALEATDLMRERAQSLRHGLGLERVETVAVQGSGPLLLEAVLELLENALRHSAPGAAVAVSTFGDGRSGLLAVSSEGPPPPTAAAAATEESRGFGLAIVRWIAEQHGGDVVHTRNGGRNTYALVLPLAAVSQATGA